jgi:malonyl-CoA/methylmalonyl-CoA synthetase
VLVVHRLVRLTGDPLAPHLLFPTMNESSSASAAADSIDIVARAVAHGRRTAIVDDDGPITYADLAAGARRGAAALLDGRADLGERRVALLVPPGRDYVTAQWATWLAGGISVPLCLSHPPAEMDHVVADSGADVIVAHPRHGETAARLAATHALRLVTTDALTAAAAPSSLPAVEPSRRALVVYTSGTTGKPKGAVATHASLRSQIEGLVEAWEWTADDRIPHVLPLHHVHGIVNVLCCALWAGAACEMLPRFDAEEVWRRFESGRITLFMAVPVIYHRLLAAWEAAPPERRAAWRSACDRLRLMVCGSAALPVPLLEAWREATGHVLLERYGMTEIGMALSNPLHGPRIPGTVGRPLPGVEVRLVDESGRPSVPGEPGEIEVRGGNVFREYWGRPAETAAAFRDGWFRTGDIAVCDDGVYRILGRNNVDIIKTGAYKVSALEIEQELLGRDDVEECAVVGVPDDEWGERVAAAVKWRAGAGASLEELRAWCKERLAVYKGPSRLLAVPELPRNAMGKVVKKDVAALFAATPAEASG